MKKLTISALILSMASTTVTAGASFEARDSDRNGKMSKDEFYSTVSDAGIYSEWDTNGDGLIEADEYGSIGVENDFSDWDSDNDSYLDAAEFYDGTYELFDENDDGVWDGNEWNAIGDAGWLDV